MSDNWIAQIVPIEDILDVEETARRVDNEHEHRDQVYSIIFTVPEPSAAAFVDDCTQAMEGDRLAQMTLMKFALAFGKLLVQRHELEDDDEVEG